MNLKQARHHFYRLINQNQLSHAYLFTGDVVAEKRELAQLVIQALACRNKENNLEPCGECRDCQRIAQGQFADLMRVQAEGRSIKVNQIRELKDWLSTSPMDSNFKATIIENAELMGPGAANALLLFLEEPGENVYIFLFSQEADLLLPTIQSRVQKIHLEAQDFEESLAKLGEKGITSSHSEIILQFSNATIQQAVENYEVQDFSSWIKVLDQFYSLLLSQNPQAFVWVQQQLKDYLTFVQALNGLDYLIWLNSQLILYPYLSEKNNSNLTQSMRDKLKGLSDKFMLQNNYDFHTYLDDLNQKLYKSKERLNANVSPQLVYERLAIYLCRWK